MLFDPVGSFVSDLPFVDALAGSQFCAIIRRAFNVSEESKKKGQPTEQIVLLHLSSKHGPVLLEMVVNIVTTRNERHAVVTGREVNIDLATLITSPGEGSTDISEASGMISWSSDWCYAPGLMMTRMTSRATASGSSGLFAVSDSAEAPDSASLVAVSDYSGSLIQRSENSLRSDERSTTSEFGGEECEQSEMR